MTWKSSQNRNFCYEPLPTARSLRLLTVCSEGAVDDISCTLDIADEGQRYTCLSYVWGPVSPMHEIKVNGQPFVVRDNLFEFLCKARKYDFREAIWIDAICINQEDVVEKSAQVQRMGSIYEQADYVIVELGLSDKTEQALHRLMTVIEDVRHLAKESGEQPKDDMAQFLYDFWKSHNMVRSGSHDLSISGVVRNALMIIDCSNPAIATQWQGYRSSLQLSQVMKDVGHSMYWKRAWVVQELLNAREARTPFQRGIVNVKDVLQCYRTWADTHYFDDRDLLYNELSMNP